MPQSKELRDLRARELATAQSIARLLQRKPEHQLPVAIPPAPEVTVLVLCCSLSYNVLSW